MEGFKKTEIAGVAVLAVAAFLWVFISFFVALQFLLIAIGIVLIGDGMHYGEPYPKLIGTALIIGGLILLLLTRIRVH
jgi:hypothetical protein